MPTLIALLSTGKGTWSEVLKIIRFKPWTKVFLITNKFGEENFKQQGSEIELVVVDFYQDVAQITNEIKNKLQGKISDFEIALNMASGVGKEHMAVLEAVLELGLNFRLISANERGVEVLGLDR